MNATAAPFKLADAAVVLGGETIPMSGLVDRAVLSDGAQFHGSYAAAPPFPHIAFDNLFSADLLEQIIREFEARASSDWHKYDTDREKTLRSRPTDALGPATQTYFNILSSRPFVQFLQEVSGIAGLLPDPMLRGGGMHESQPGGKFHMHLDFEKHPVTLLDNRLVFITYLNKGWRREWGGCLEFWDMEANCKVTDVVPEFGRSVLFCHSDKSLHGHPHPVVTPDGRPRRSLAAYYYSNGREDGLTAARYTTYFAPQPVSPVRAALGASARAVTPPILYDALRRLVAKR
jgi:hypothetical protein